MKKFRVTLAKAYSVDISAENSMSAKRLAEFYTGDIQDISSDGERRSDNFLIDTIICRTNDAIDCLEIDDE